MTMKEGSRMKRRSFIAGAAALTCTTALRAEVNFGCDPILAHYADWRAASAEFLRLSYEPGNENMDSTQILDAEQRQSAAFHAMLDMTPVAPAGVAALAHVLWEFKGPYRQPDPATPHPSTGRIPSRAGTYGQQHRWPTGPTTKEPEPYAVWQSPAGAAFGASLNSLLFLSLVWC